MNTAPHDYSLHFFNIYLKMNCLVSERKWFYNPLGVATEPPLVKTYILYPKRGKSGNMQQ